MESSAEVVRKPILEAGFHRLLVVVVVVADTTGQLPLMVHRSYCQELRSIHSCRPRILLDIQETLLHAPMDIGVQTVEN